MSECEWNDGCGVGNGGGGCGREGEEVRVWEFGVGDARSTRGRRGDERASGAFVGEDCE